MFDPDIVDRIAHLVDPRGIEVLDVMGPTIQLLTKPENDDNAPCVMRGTIPAGVFVPLHSHPDPETFVVTSGELEGLAETGHGPTWMPIRTGDVFHVPGGARHAFRNRSPQAAVSIVISASRLGRFFEEVGMPAVPGARPKEPPSGEAIAHFLEVAARYGYWNATPDENARIGLRLPAAS